MGPVEPLSSGGAGGCGGNDDLFLISLHRETAICRVHLPSYTLSCLTSHVLWLSAVTARPDMTSPTLRERTPGPGTAEGRGSTCRQIQHPRVSGTPPPRPGPPSATLPRTSAVSEPALILAGTALRSHMSLCIDIGVIYCHGTPQSRPADFQERRFRVITYALARNHIPVNVVAAGRAPVRPFPTTLSIVNRLRSAVSSSPLRHKPGIFVLCSVVGWRRNTVGNY